MKNLIESVSRYGIVIFQTSSQLDSNSESHAYAQAGAYDLCAFGFFSPFYFLD